MDFRGLKPLQKLSRMKTFLPCSFFYTSQHTAYNKQCSFWLKKFLVYNFKNNTLENKKLSAAGKIQLTSVNYVVFSDFRCGYRINFRISEQSNRKAEL